MCAIQARRAEADWLGMRPAAAFASVLDAKLNPDAAAFTARGIATTPWLGPVLAHAARNPGAWRIRGDEPGAARARVPAARGVELRTLPARARTAVDTLRAAGAVLPDRCTSADLRRAFRQLARLYHPDRYPHGSRREHERLAATFSDVDAAYTLLRRELAARSL